MSREISQNKYLFSNRLKMARNATLVPDPKDGVMRPINQGELAKKAKISQGSISAYENDNRVPDIDVVNKMLTVLKVDPSWFVTGMGGLELADPASKEIQDEESEADIEAIRQALLTVFKDAALKADSKNIEQMLEIISKRLTHSGIISEIRQIKEDDPMMKRMMEAILCANEDLREEVKTLKTKLKKLGGDTGSEM